MRRQVLIALGVLAVAGTTGAPATAQTPPAKMVIFEFIERVA